MMTFSKIAVNTGVFLIFLIFNSLAFAQNLVPNPSFEQITNCPSTYNQVSYSTGWKPSYQNNVSPHHTEFLHSCNGGNFSTPSSVWGTQVPATGQAYMAMATLSTAIASNYRENIYVQLTSPLIPGTQYRLSYKASSANVTVGSNRLGMKLSTVQTFLVNNQAHMWSSNVINDQTSWITISDTIVADSAYKYVALGNFFTDANTTVQTICGSCSLPHCVYFVDDVEVVPICSANSSFSSPGSVCINSPVQFQNTSSGSTSYQWNFGDGNTSTGINPIHSYSSAGTYIVQLLASNSCAQDISFVQIQVLPAPTVSAGSDVVICEGDSVNLSANGSIAYTWNPTLGLNNPSISNPVSGVPSTITYTVTGSNNICSDIDEVIVNVIPKPNVFAGSDVHVCDGSGIQLQASGASAYSWTPDPGLSVLNGSMTSALPSATSTYTVTGTSSN